MEIRPSIKLMLFLLLPLREAESSVKYQKILKIQLVKGGDSASVIQEGKIGGYGQPLKGKTNTTDHSRQEGVPLPEHYLPLPRASRGSETCCHRRWELPGTVWRHPASHCSPWGCSGMVTLREVSTCRKCNCMGNANRSWGALCGYFDLQYAFSTPLFWWPGTAGITKVDKFSSHLCHEIQKIKLHIDTDNSFIINPSSYRKIVGLLTQPLCLKRPFLLPHYVFIWFTGKQYRKGNSRTICNDFQ